jgi:hypothetical protein
MITDIDRQWAAERIGRTRVEWFSLNVVGHGATPIPSADWQARVLVKL